MDAGVEAGEGVGGPGHGGLVVAAAAQRRGSLRGALGRGRRWDRGWGRGRRGHRVVAGGDRDLEGAVGGGCAGEVGRDEVGGVAGGEADAFPGEPAPAVDRGEQRITPDLTRRRGERAGARVGAVRAGSGGGVQGRPEGPAGGVGVGRREDLGPAAVHTRRARAGVVGRGEDDPVEGTGGDRELPVGGGGGVGAVEADGGGGAEVGVVGEDEEEGVAAAEQPVGQPTDGRWRMTSVTSPSRAAVVPVSAGSVVAGSVVAGWRRARITEARAGEGCPAAVWAAVTAARRRRWVAGGAGWPSRNSATVTGCAGIDVASTAAHQSVNRFHS